MWVHTSILIPFLQCDIKTIASIIMKYVSHTITKPPLVKRSHHIVIIIVVSTTRFLVV